MKKFFAVVVCCALTVTNVSAQEGSSVVEQASSDVVLASGQEPAVEAQNSATDVVAAPVTSSDAPATFVMQDPAVVDAPVVEGAAVEAPMYGQAVPAMSTNSGCGCGGGVVTNYAAPMSGNAANGCCQPVDPCCSSNQNRGFRGFRARMASRRNRGNDCCSN